MDRLEYYLRNWKQYRKTIEAAIVIILIAAVLIFGGNGEKQKIPGKTPPQAPDETGQIREEPPRAKMYVDVSGKVKNPGVYEIKEGTRLFEVIEMAGGLLDDADVNGFNQAEIIRDEDKIVIPSETGGDEASTNMIRGGKVDINMADSEALKSIPGIGPSMADRIIKYREENGRFRKKEDLKNVSGIGDKVYEKLKDMVTV